MSTSIDDFDIPLSEIEKKVMDWAEEALELRHGAGEDPEGTLAAGFADLDVEHSREIISLMFRIRQRSDRVDYLASLALRAKGRALRAQNEAKFIASNKYDEAMSSRSQTKREFTSSRELHANASLDSVDDRRLAHKAERLVSLTQESYEVINQIGWQLQRLRDDLKEMLRTLRFEHSLDQ
jgi:hypothetical protein